MSSVLRPDWGNAQMIGFQDMVRDWPGRVHAVGADTFFKIVIRRAPQEEPPVWSWALEWNHSLRLVGFFGDDEAVQASIHRLPLLKKILLERGMDPEKGRYETWGRIEVTLADADDRLFECPSNLVASSASDGPTESSS